jgi:hypothetical protein
MEDLISAFITPEGEKQLQDAIANLDKILQEIKAINAVTINFTKGAKDAKTLADLELKLKKIEEAEARLIERQAKATQATEKLDEARKKMAENAEKSARRIALEADEYGKLSKQYQETARAAQNMAARGETGTKAFRDTAKAAKELHDQLKAIDTSVGKHTRNVGNYASGFDSLRNSVSQIVRETPSLANGFNQFFLAISNNLGPMQDAMAGAREKNRLLAEEGKASVPVWRQVASAFLSWNTAIGLGITLLASYGGELIKWIGNLISGKNELTAINIAQKAYNASIAEISKATAEATVSINDLERAVKDHGLSAEQKQKAIENWNSKNKDSVKELKNVKDAEDFLIKNKQTYIDMMTAKAEATFYTNQVIAAQTKLLELQADKELHAADFWEGIWGRAKKVAGVMGKALPGFDMSGQLIVKAYKGTEAAVTKASEEGRAKRTKGAQKEYDVLVDIQSKALDKLRGITAGKDAFSPESDAAKKAAREAAKERKRLQREAQQEKDRIDKLNKYYEDRIIKVTIKNLKEAAKEVKKAEKSIAKDRFQKKQDELDVMSKLSEDDARESLQQEDRMSALRRNLVKDEKKMILDASIKLEAELQNLAFSAIDARYERQLQSLKKQMDLIQKVSDAEMEAIDRSGKSDEEKEKLKQKLAGETEAQTIAIQNREKEVKRKQAIADRAAAIASIIQQTAIAIASTGKLLFAGIPLAVLYAAIGAAQIASVLAQPLPQFWKGTQNSPEGPAIVGEKGSELRIDPDGKMSLTPQSPTLTYLRSGTKIIPADATADLIRSFMAGEKLDSSLVSDSRLLEATIAGNKALLASNQELIKTLKAKEFKSRDNSFEYYKRMKMGG